MSKQVVTVVDDDGGIYEATKEGQGEYWTIAFPRGDDKFYGTVPAVEAHMKGLIKRHAEQDKEGAANE